ncbi:putative protease [Caminicella sporogenes DSM 14501]|uniref:Putative protease n=1 Tax=Caminicella sporogenes DSM 14501 TaxID=1121266 RepID=A0A1M6R2X6_9FIRM|nr:U32 family peptidase [Caminicella sporogenes]SHK26750.1 putative protease [Caminicella sporogenes DSM 14501]
MKKVELLAPVGSYEAMIAAVQNGADAIYLGGKNFGARQYANNFGNDELKKAVEYCHIRGVKTYITVNTLISNNEFYEFEKYINYLYNIDVDAVILQDLGVLKYIRENYPDFEIHASTQMTIHNLDGVKLLKEFGVKRVVLPREMDLKEIKYIKENSDVELEVFIHGALCISYSGQCLMSSLIGGRSGNRGRCAQPCRLPYKLVDLESNKEMANINGNYILSSRDLNTIEKVGEIIDVGVNSLKIEGRMKRPEYVATVVYAYKAVIDEYLSTGKINVNESLRKDLEKIFNRKFTKGYLFGEYGKDIMSFEKPGNRGIKLGRVIEINKKSNKLKIKLFEDLRKGDGIKIKLKSSSEDDGIIVNKIYSKDKIIYEAKAGQIVEIDYKVKGNIENIIYKTADIELLERARKSFAIENKKVPIYGAIKCKLGKKLEVYIWDTDGNYINFVGDKYVEKAVNKPLTEERIIKQMNKLGGTPYYFEKLEVELDDNILIPISEINEVRRNAIDKLNNARKRRNNRKYMDLIINELSDSKNNNIQGNGGKVSLRVYVNNLKQLEAVLKCNVDLIYYSNLYDIDEAIKVSEKYNKLIVPALSRITDDREMAYIRQNLENIKRTGHILVSNHGQLNLLRNTDVNIYTDFSFNIFNNMALKKISDLGVKCCTLSLELTFAQIRDIVKNADINCEVLVYGHLPMMIMKYCAIKTAIKNEKKLCNICRNKKFGLKDRYGNVFPILTDNNCKVQILNSKKLFLIEYIKELLDNDLGLIRLQFTNEKKNEIIDIVKAYEKMIEDVLKGKKIISEEIIQFIEKYKSNNDYTKGHFFRGVE